MVKVKEHTRKKGKIKVKEHKRSKGIPEAPGKYRNSSENVRIYRLNHEEFKKLLQLRGRLRDVKTTFDEVVITTVEGEVVSKAEVPALTSKDKIAMEEGEMRYYI